MAHTIPNEIVFVNENLFLQLTNKYCISRNGSMSEWVVRADRNFRVLPLDTVFEASEDKPPLRVNRTVTFPYDDAVPVSEDTIEKVALFVPFKDHGQLVALDSTFEGSQMPKLMYPDPQTGARLEAPVSAEQLAQGGMNLIACMPHGIIQWLRGEPPQPTWHVWHIYPWSRSSAEITRVGSEPLPRQWEVYSYTG